MAYCSIKSFNRVFFEKKDIVCLIYYEMSHLKTLLSIPIYNNYILYTTSV